LAGRIRWSAAAAGRRVKHSSSGIETIEVYDRHAVYARANEVRGIAEAHQGKNAAASVELGPDRRVDHLPRDQLVRRTYFHANATIATVCACGHLIRARAAVHQQTPSGSIGTDHTRTLNGSVAAYVAATSTIQERVEIIHSNRTQYIEAPSSSSPGSAIGEYPTLPGRNVNPATPAIDALEMCNALRSIVARHRITAGFPVFQPVAVVGCVLHGYVLDLESAPVDLNTDATAIIAFVAVYDTAENPDSA
jgi:hypothetical protein